MDLIDVTCPRCGAVERSCVSKDGMSGGAYGFGHICISDEAYRYRLLTEQLGRIEAMLAKLLPPAK